MTHARLMSGAAAALVLILAGCATFTFPDDYVPDERVVYLAQKAELDPIRYEPAAADPYVFQADPTPVDAARPAFLRETTWDSLLKADFRGDSRLHREVEAHFLRVASLPAFTRLRARLDAGTAAAPPPLPPTRGEKRRDYSNGAAFAYPEVPGAQITILNNGDYTIDFPDGGAFRYWRGGRYERTDAGGAILFRHDPTQSREVGTTEGYTLTSRPDYRSVKGPEGTVEYLADPTPQYRFTAADGAPAQEYVLFPTAGRIREIATRTKGGLRWDYFFDTRTVLVTSGREAIAIESDFRKRHSHFDVEQRKEAGPLTLYFPEGIRLTGFDAPALAHSEIQPQWPEQYRSRSVGPFGILYTAKDEPLVDRPDAARLAEVAARCGELTGLAAAAGRTILVPPDLEAYRKLHASGPGEVLRWYPSGFESRDLIVMWPLSVPRYRAAGGEEYFFSRELYEIAAHEYVHLLVGENTGLRSPVPAWLDEGLAVYVESELSRDARRYWDVTFAVCRRLNRVLDWDDATVTPTGHRDIAQARVHYAQSYALVGALMRRFGPAKIAEYVKSFRVPAGEAADVDVKAAYRAKLRSVFAIDLSEALAMLANAEGE